VSLLLRGLNAICTGSWLMHTQLPYAAALTRPAASTVVITTRQELGANSRSQCLSGTSTFDACDMEPSGVLDQRA
jgi:hypothetical protein